LQKIIFITGTDTGVGKTVLTALLLSHLRQTGACAFALKPFCCGDRADAELLHSLQNGDLTLDEINPFYFPEPVAPLVAARKHNRQIQMGGVLRDIRSVLSRPSAIENQKSKIESPTLLIEGAGGLLAPLGERFNLLDLIVTAERGLKSSIQYPASSIQIIVIAANRLGTINHTLLTLHALQACEPREIKVVLVDNDRFSTRNTQHATCSPSRITHHVSRLASRSNPSILTELLAPIPLFHVPYLTQNPSKPAQIEQFSKKYKKTLAQILA
jgi:dethiobiotin synthetase